MAGGHMKYRQLGRHSAHRQSLLRNLVTSLIKHESIMTTWPKAKEAQRLAEKLITHAKKNTNASRLRAQQILFTPLEHLPALFGTLRERYLNRPGGYTRVLRTEPRNKHDDQAPTAILELVDGPRDIRFAMTARTIARERALDGEIREVTLQNIAKVTRFRNGGEEALQKTVRAVETAQGFDEKVDGEREEIEKRRSASGGGPRAISDDVAAEVEEDEYEDDALESEIEIQPRRERRGKQIDVKPNKRKAARPIR